MEWAVTANSHFIELISSYLPDRIRRAVGLIDGEYINQLEEIRIRKALPLMGVFAGLDFFISTKGLLYHDPKSALIVSSQEMESLFLLICEHSIYAFQNEINKGFITLKGGHRVGICGTAVYEGEKIVTLKDISSVNIRFSRQIRGCAQKVFHHLMRGKNDIYNTLILSPPRLGKTTLLRDICRIISQGIPNGVFNALRTAVIDERSEIAAVYRGIPQNDIGPRTDVMDGCRKSDGIEIMLRGMAPQVIIVDELGGDQDGKAVRRAWNAGVRLIATAHSYGLDDFKGRLGAGKLVEQGGFERILLLRWVRVMDINGNKLGFFAQDSGKYSDFDREYNYGDDSFEQARRETAFVIKTNRGPT